MSDEGMSGEMLERYARGEASVSIPTFTRDVYRHLLARLDAAERELSALREQHSTVCDTAVQACTERDAAERERDALREALAKIANYDRKHKTPQRDGRMADTTHLYLQGFARAALTANHSATVVEE